MRRSLLAFLALSASSTLWAVPALADPLTNDPSGCGGDAYSSAEVVEGRRPRRGPITAMPDSMCADLAPSIRPPGVDLYVAPGLPGPYGSGGGYGPGPGYGPPGPGYGPGPGYDPRGGYDAGGPGPGGLGDGGVYAPYGERLPPRLRRGD